jgi:anti-anti-sigma factor
VPVTQEVLNDGKLIYINIKGRFDYTLSQDFRNAYRHVPAHEGMSFHVDLSNTDYMDSSALGMMLLLREHAKCRGGSVTIKHPSEPIDKILKVANFEQLFTIN